LWYGGYGTIGIILCLTEKLVKYETDLTLGTILFENLENSFQGPGLGAGGSSCVYLSEK
jgi:hypothetical protein